MRLAYALGFASVYGLTVRLLFGILGDFTGIMTLSFLVLVPFVIGFLTIFLQPKRKDIGNGAAFFQPWLSSLVILVITIVFDIEGGICWIMIYPMFAIVAGIGGLTANRFRKQKVEITDEENHDFWTKPDKMATSFVMVIPFIIAILEGERSLSRLDMEITEEIVIASTPAKIWAALGSEVPTQKMNNGVSLSGLLGFPRHLQTTIDTFALGGKRIAFYENGLYFKETVVGYIPEKSLVLAIKTDPLNIPPKVMDEHILIGGKHVDILTDNYELNQLAPGKCRVTLTSKFYINTPFNWYAAIWSKFLMRDILKGELKMIQSIAQR